MTANEWIKEIHGNAVAHGWWDTHRSLPEVLALCHSELSEALEADRAGEPMVWKSENGKLEGVAVELADCVIRICDYLGYIDAYAFLDFFHCDLQDEYDYDSFAEFIAYCHYALSTVMESKTNTKTSNRLIHCIMLIRLWFEFAKEEFESVIDAKHEYNKGRPYKHGKRY